MSAVGGQGERNHLFQVVDGHDYLIVGTFAGEREVLPWNMYCANPPLSPSRKITGPKLPVSPLRSKRLYHIPHIVPDRTMERLIRTIVLEHKNKRIRLTEIEGALKERGINLFADQSRHRNFIETVDVFIARGILEPLKGARPLQQYRGFPDRYTIHRGVIADAGTLSPEHRNELVSLSPPISIDYSVTHGDDVCSSTPKSSWSRRKTSSSRYHPLRASMQIFHFSSGQFDSHTTSTTGMIGLCSPLNCAAL
jgi:hypothetical protein